MKKWDLLFFMLLTLAFFACDDDAAEAVVDTEDHRISLQAPTGETEVFADDLVEAKLL